MLVDLFLKKRNPENMCKPLNILTQFYEYLLNPRSVIFGGKKEKKNFLKHLLKYVIFVHSYLYLGVPGTTFLRWGSAVKLMYVILRVLDLKMFENH